MTLPEQIEVLKKVAELKTSKACMFFRVNPKTYNGELIISQTATGKQITTRYFSPRNGCHVKIDSCANFTDYSTCIRVLDKMIEQHKAVKA